MVKKGIKSKSYLPHKFTTKLTFLLMMINRAVTQL